MGLWGSAPFLQELWLLISLPQALLEVTAQPSFPGQSHPTGFSCQGCSREDDGSFLRVFLRFSELTWQKEKENGSGNGSFSTTFPSQFALRAVALGQAVEE